MASSRGIRLFQEGRREGSGVGGAIFGGRVEEGVEGWAKGAKRDQEVPHLLA